MALKRSLHSVAPITVPRWDRQNERRVEILSDTAVWYHTGMSVVPQRWVLIHDPLGKLATQALLCTDQTAGPERILSRIVQRCQLETLL